MSDPVTPTETKLESKQEAKPVAAKPVTKTTAKQAAPAAATPAKPAAKKEAKPVAAKREAKDAKPDTQVVAPAKPDKDSWSRLATAVNGCRTVNELVKKAGLRDWNVTPHPVSSLVPTSKCTDCDKPMGKKHTPDCLMEAEQPSESGTVEPNQTVVPVTVPGMFGLIRVNPDGEFGFESIGHTTREKSPVPIETRTSILTEIVKQTGAKMGPAGPLWDNTAAFASIRIPEPVKAGKDLVDIRVVLINSLVSGRPSQIMICPVRIATQTVQTYTFPNFPNRLQLTPDNDHDARITEASEALDLLSRYTDEFSQQATKLLRKRMSAQEFSSYSLQLFPYPGDTASKGKRETFQQCRTALDLLFKGATDITADIKGTRWAALQTVLTWLEHLNPPKVAGDSGLFDRAMDTLFGKTLAQKAYDLLREG